MPCAVAIRTAKAVTREVPQASSTSLGSLAACTETNSERDVHRLTKKFNLTIPIEISEASVAETTIPFFKFSSWAKWLLSMNLWHVLCGLHRPDSERCAKRWTKFWSRYREAFPNHHLFRSNRDLSRTCGLYLHGDEGRSIAKTAIMIVSVHSVMGYGLASAGRRRDAREFGGMRLNYKSPTWCTRFLLGVMPKQHYSEDVDGTDSFQDLMKAIATDLKDLFDTGISGPDGQVYRFCVLNIMGDWPFQVKCGNLSRSFYNVSKHSSSRAPPKGICHRCLADRTGVVWEDFEAAAPAWLPTVDTECPFLKIPEVLCLQPNGEDQPSFFAWDFFHAWHLGAGKGIIASAIVVLATSSAFNGSIDTRISAVSDSFQAWCRDHNIKPRLRKITKEKLSYPATTSYPQGTWSKGATTTYLLKWLVVAFEEHMADLLGDRLVELTYHAISSINNFVGGIYGWEIWIPSNEAATLATTGLKFLKFQGRAAIEAYHGDRRLFLAMPNLHRLHHIFFDMLEKSRTAPYVLNPLALSTQADEDFIGRPSRLSRRVSPRLTILRTLQRSLLAARASYVNAGILIA